MQYGKAKEQTKAIQLRVPRISRGNSLIEIGPFLFILFLLIFFPLVTLATTGMRYLFCVNAVHRAALAASLAQTFQTNRSSTNLSAVNLAQQVAAQNISAFTGITLMQTNTFIIITPDNGSAQTKQSVPLTTPANTTNNVYNVEVQLVASINPWIAGTFLHAQIPGLNAPFTITTVANVVFENTQGLTQ